MARENDHRQAVERDADGNQGHNSFVMEQIIDRKDANQQRDQPRTPAG
jgi:hypothetical protein